MHARGVDVSPRPESAPFVARWLVVVLFGAASSKGPTSIAASSYDRSCASIADCAAAYEGPVSCCGTGVGCDNTAVSQRALDAQPADGASD